MYTQEVSKIRHILPSDALRLSLKDINLRILVLASSFDVLEESLASSWGIMLFILPLTVIYGTGEYLLLRFVMQVSKDLRKKNDIVVTMVVQYVVSAILILVVLQLLGSYFCARLIIADTLVSYILATIIMGILSYSL